MPGWHLLPWEYGVRNLFRRPLRTVLTLCALTTVILLILVVVGFIRGLEQSLANTGDPQVAIVFSLGMGENLEYSSIPMRTSGLVPANISGIQERYGTKYVSPELYLGTRIGVSEKEEGGMGLVRGVEPTVLLVRQRVELEEGEWPQTGECLVGRLASTKLGADPARLQVGERLTFEGRTWRISGRFSAAGTAFESEVWCRLDDLQQAMKRQDLSLVAMKLGPSGDFTDVDLFCKERLDLELQAIRETDYYATLRRDYEPVRMLAWLVVFLVAGAGFFAGLNTMYGAAIGRIREFASLQTIGYGRRAIYASLLQEAVLLSMTASLLASSVAIFVLNGVAVRFTMGAFPLCVDGTAVLIGCAVGLMLGMLGTIPPALKTFRLPVVDGLKAI